MEVNNGLVIAFKYDSDLTRDPAEIKIGHRKWVDVRGAKKKSSCATTSSNVPVVDDPRRLGQYAFNSLPIYSTSAKMQAHPLVAQKIGPDDPITQEDLIDLSFMLDALTYAQFEDFNAKQRCIDRCNDLATAGSFICVAIGLFGGGVPGAACELSIGVHWLACRVGCSTMP